MMHLAIALVMLTLGKAAHADWCQGIISSNGVCIGPILTRRYVIAIMMRRDGAGDGADCSRVTDGRLRPTTGGIQKRARVRIEKAPATDRG